MLHIQLSDIFIQLVMNLFLAQTCEVFDQIVPTNEATYMNYVVISYQVLNSLSE